MAGPASGVGRIESVLVACEGGAGARQSWRGDDGYRRIDPAAENAARPTGERGFTGVFSGGDFQSLQSSDRLADRYAERASGERLGCQGVRGKRTGTRAEFAGPAGGGPLERQN